MRETKLIFIEWDGACWRIINRLLAEGKLPHLRKLMERGVHSALASEAPYISARLWTSIYSGKKPAKHGVQFFGATSRDVKCKRVWDIAEEHGLKIGVFGTLITWPPHPVNGFLVPSVFALGPECYPPDLQFLQELILDERKKKEQSFTKLKTGLSRVLKLRRYGGSASSFWRIARYLAWEKMSRPGFLDRYWRKADIHLRMTADVFTRLYSSAQPDVATFHIHLCDAVSHRYWAFMEPEEFDGIPPDLIERFKSVIPHCYEEADRVIGKIAALADARTTIIISSDHGFTALPAKLMPYKLEAEKFLNMFELDGHALPAQFGLSTFFYFQDADLKSRVANELSDVTLPELATKLFLIKDQENYLEVAVKWQLLKNQISDETVVDLGRRGRYPLGSLFSKAGGQISGGHHPEAILVLAGAPVDPDAKLRQPCIYDLAPTMLALLGLPVAEDMDGRVLEEAFAQEFLCKHPISHIPTYETEGTVVASQETSDYEKIKDRLRSLGYL